VLRMLCKPLWSGTFLLSFAVGIGAVTLTYMSAEGNFSGENKILPHVDEAKRLQPSQKDEQSEERRWEERYSNDTEIGRRGKNKIELVCQTHNEWAAAKIEFFSRGREGEWTGRQYLSFENLNYVGCDAEISDFNNDGYNDITFRSGQAARGANEIRTLLIYDAKNDELMHIKNSAEYANLSYNKELNCIDAWHFHRATTTIFLKLEGDRLREIASVDTGEERIVTNMRRNGERVITRREKMHVDDIFTKYSTYDPPTP
jgi:hypothetical protein